jgi:hypothetical protein
MNKTLQGFMYTMLQVNASSIACRAAYMHIYTHSIDDIYVTWATPLLQHSC